MFDEKKSWIKNRYLNRLKKKFQISLKNSAQEYPKEKILAPSER
ncbi:MAG: hypothetical protein M2R45_02141 [Verrucomicrobia subdivision 3 bacterium]|nr:hypothetical protein [Limisphaerales bacterium]MCS1413718.1 hypothetical protein [Limisphaerales bacterium]